MRLAALRPSKAAELAAFLCLGVVVPTGCAGGVEAPLSEDRLVAEVIARKEPMVTSEELIGVWPLALPLDPEAPPDSAAYWTTRAVVHAPAVRQARRMWEAQAAREPAAGAPNPTSFFAEVEDFEDFSRGGRLSAMVDLLGLFGIGPRAAAAELARTQTQSQKAQLEREVWEAYFDAARLHLRLRFLRSEMALFHTILKREEPSLRRLQTLASAGRIARALANNAFARVAAFEQDLVTLSATEAAAINALANASGHTANSPAFEAVQALVEAELRGAPGERPSQRSLQELLRGLPALRQELRQFAVAEARVRLAAQSAVPLLNVEPMARIRPSDWLFGGELMIDVAWPAAVEATVMAAAVDREAQRDRIADRLREASNRQEALSARLSAAEKAIAIGSEQRARASSAARGARARLMIAEDMESIEEWMRALNASLQTELQWLRALEERAQCSLDLSEAMGVSSIDPRTVAHLGSR